MSEPKPTTPAESAESVIDGLANDLAEGMSPEARADFDSFVAEIKAIVLPPLQGEKP